MRGFFKKLLNFIDVFHRAYCYNYIVEKDLQKNVINYLREQGYMCYSINPPNFKRMTYGTLMQLPDIHIVDINTFIELKDKQYKSNHKERQEKQERVRQELIAHGAKAYKITTLDELKEILCNLT